MGMIKEKIDLLDLSMSILKKYYPSEKSIKENLIPIVNSKEVGWDYILKKGDELIFNQTFKYPMILKNKIN